MSLTVGLLATLQASTLAKLESNRQPAIDKLVASFEAHATGAAVNGKEEVKLTFPVGIDSTVPGSVVAVLQDAGFTVVGNVADGETVAVSWPAVG